MRFRDQSRITLNGASPKRLKADMGTQVMCAWVEEGSLTCSVEIPLPSVGADEATECEIALSSLRWEKASNWWNMDLMEG